MKKNYYIPILFILILIIQIGCARTKINNYPIITKKSLALIKTKCPLLPEQDFIIYYFDPKCGLCLSQAKALEENSDGLKSLFIITSEIDEVIDFQIDKLDLSSCFIVDKNGIFSNELVLNQKIILKKGGKIVAFDGDSH